MKFLGLFVAAVSLVFLAACGAGGGPSNPGTGPAGYTNANFSGTYVFTLAGECVSACNNSVVLQSVGTMTADGKGNITGGNWDLNIGGAYTPPALSLSGTYGVNSDGTATVTVNDGVATDSFVVMLTSPNGGYIEANDNQWALSGTIQKATAAASAPSGKYVFKAAGLTASSDAWAIAGAMDFTSGDVTADTNEAGSSGGSFLLQTGTVTAVVYDSASGRGTFTIVPSGGNPITTMNYVFYVVDANTLELLSTDASFGFQGRAEISGGAVGSPLTGAFAFLGSGFPQSGQAQVSEGGVFTGDGAGGVSSGVIDTVFDNNGQTGVAFTATGTVSTVNGVTRDVVTLVPSSASVTPLQHASVWMANSGRGFFVSGDGDRAEIGTIQSQTGAPFTDNGTFGFVQTGWALTSNGAQGLTYVTLFSNKDGKVGGYTQALNIFGSPNVTTGDGTLTFNSAGTIGNLTLNNTAIGQAEDFRIYQYSASQAFIMEVDQTAITSGTMTAQTAQ
jgi:hypothetical protein